MKRLFLFLALLFATPCAAQQLSITGTVPPCLAFGTTTGTCIQGAGALGTPSSGSAANLTGLPATGITMAGIAWTPAIAFGGSATGITYSNQTGIYFKIGNIVWYFGKVVLSSKGAQTGAATITGFPTTSVNADLTNASNGLVGLSGSMLTLTSDIIVQVNSNSTTAALNVTGATGNGTLSNTNFTDTSYLYFSGMYYSQ